MVKLSFDQVICFFFLTCFRCKNAVKALAKDAKKLVLTKKKEFAAISFASAAQLVIVDLIVST